MMMMMMNPVIIFDIFCSFFPSVLPTGEIKVYTLLHIALDCTVLYSVYFNGYVFLLVSHACRICVIVTGYIKDYLT